MESDVVLKLNNYQDWTLDRNSSKVKHPKSQTITISDSARYYRIPDDPTLRFTIKLQRIEALKR